jgi:hypothetical protein
VRQLANEILQTYPRIDVLANILFTYQLTRRLQTSAVTANALRSYDQAAAARLWKASGDLDGLTAAD